MTPSAPPQPRVEPRPRLGTVVLVATLVVAAVGMTVSVVQLDNALDGRPRDRTVLGVVLMTLGFLGPVVALIALARWRTLRLMGLRQWWSLALFPGSFLILWVIGAVVYAVSDPMGRLIIPHTPTLTVRFDPEGRPQFHPRGGFGFRGYEQHINENRANGVLVGDIPFDFRVHPDESGVRAVTFTGTVTRTEGKRVEL